jgi:hypothetical protein
MTLHSRYESSGLETSTWQHTKKQTPMPRWEFFWFFVGTLSVYFCPDCTSFCLYVLTVRYTQYKIHAPGWTFFFLGFLYFICTTSLSWLSWLCLLSLLYNTHNTNIHAPSGIELATPASDRPQTLALDLSATGIGTSVVINKISSCFFVVTF